MRKTYCPTVGQTETRYQQIRKVHTALNIQEKGQILTRKCLTRCLCSSNNINIQVRQEKGVIINTNKIALSSTQQEQHRTYSEQKFMTDVNIFLNPRYRMRKHNIITSSFNNYQWPREFCNAKNISITEKNSVWQKKYAKYHPPNGMTHVCKADPFSKSACLVPIFNARGQWFCKYLLLQKLATNKTNQSTNGILKYPFYTLNSRTH